MPTERKKINVSIYVEELETVKEKLDIKEDVELIKGKVIREALGLKSSGRGFGVARQIKEKMKDMTDEQKVAFETKLQEVLSD